MVCWLGRCQVDDTCRCVAPIERALWTAQDLDVANIVEFLFEEVVADKRNIVERNRNSRIGGDGNRLCADAADLNVVAGEVCLRKGEVRHLLYQIGAAIRLRGGQLLLRQGRD